MAQQEAPRRGRVRALLAELRSDPIVNSRRTWPAALRVGVGLGMPVGFVPAALLLELAPQLGFLRPAGWSFVGSVAVFTLLARARNRAVPWIAAAAVSLLLVIGAVLATAWTLTRSVSDALSQLG